VIDGACMVEHTSCNFNENSYDFPLLTLTFALDTVTSLTWDLSHEVCTLIGQASFCTHFMTFTFKLQAEVDLRDAFPNDIDEPREPKGIQTRILYGRYVHPITSEKYTVTLTT
jgi:hypothetical protein